MQGRSTRPDAAVPADAEPTRKKEIADLQARVTSLEKEAVQLKSMLAAYRAFMDNAPLTIDRELHWLAPGPDSAQNILQHSRNGIAHQ